MLGSHLERARKTLLKLRDEFEHEARRDQDLHNVLFCAPSFDHPKASELPPASWLYDENPIKRYWDGPDNTILIFYYHGQQERLEDKFGRLALHATRAWEALVRPVQIRQPHSPIPDPGINWQYEDLPGRFGGLRDRLDVSLWLLVVHSLAWKRLPGSPLVARRKIWDKTWPVGGYFTLPYELEPRLEALEALPPAPRDMLRGEPIPDYYFSALPCDVFRASAFAIDLLMELCSPEGWVDGIEQGSGVASTRALFSPDPHNTPPQIPFEEPNQDETHPDNEGGQQPPITSGTDEGHSYRPSPPRRRFTRLEAERLVGVFLLDNHGATIRAVHEATGVSTGLISKLNAWKLDAPYRGQKGRTGRTRNTKSGKIELAEAKNTVDPVVLKEMLSPYFMDNAPKSDRVEYLRSSPIEQAEILVKFFARECDRLKSLAESIGDDKIKQEIDEMIDSGRYELLVNCLPQFAERLEE